MTIKGFPVHHSENSTYYHLMSSAPPQVIPEKSPPTSPCRKEHFKTQTIPFSCHGHDAVTNNKLFFNALTYYLPLQSIWQIKVH